MVAMLPVVAPSGSEQAQKHQIALLAFYTQTMAWTGRGGFMNHDPRLNGLLHRKIQNCLAEPFGKTAAHVFGVYC